MASYPSSIWTPPTRGVNMSDATTQTDIEDAQQAEIVAMQTEFGTAPSGADATVRVTLDRLRTAVPAAWTTWSSPTVAGLTKTSGTEVAAYFTIGQVTFCYYRFVFGASSAITGDLQITTPTTHIHGSVTGTGYFDDNTGGEFPIHIFSVGTTVALLRAVNTASTYASSVAVSSTIPYTWATSDEIVAQFHYRI